LKVALNTITLTQIEQIHESFGLFSSNLTVLFPFYILPFDRTGSYLVCCLSIEMRCMPISLHRNTAIFVVRHNCDICRFKFVMKVYLVDP